MFVINGVLFGSSTEQGEVNGAIALMIAPHINRRVTARSCWICCLCLTHRVGQNHICTVYIRYFGR